MRCLYVVRHECSASVRMYRDCPVRRGLHGARMDKMIDLASMGLALSITLAYSVGLLWFWL